MHYPAKMRACHIVYIQPIKTAVGTT